MNLIINTEFMSISSMLGSILVIFGILYFLYDFILTIVFKLDKIVVFKLLYLSDVISIILALYTIINYITIGSP